MLDLIFCFIELKTKRMQIDSLVRDEQFDCVLFARIYFNERKKKKSAETEQKWSEKKIKGEKRQTSTFNSNM